MKNPIRYEMIVGVLDLAILEQDGTIIAYTRKTDGADTIVAISTPPGRGGIGIVRLSGPQAVDFAAQLVHLRQPLEHARARLADVLESSSSSNSARIDEALVTYFAAPNSYTAEDLVEIAAHGSPVVLSLLLDRALELGARLVEQANAYADSQQIAKSSEVKP